VRGVRRPRRQPHVRGLPLPRGRQRGPLLHPRVPEAALEAPQARLRQPRGLQVWGIHSSTSQLNLSRSCH